MDPLAQPEATSPTLALFREHFRLKEPSGDPQLLEATAAAFSTIPYENLTKIMRGEQSGGDRVKRLPHDVISEHVEWGGGGTCFSLTAALLHILRALGWHAEPLLADRHYGANTHCALVVWIEDRPHLLDPGYLIVRPIALDPEHETKIETSFNEVVLRPTQGGERLELHTAQDGGLSHRLTFKTSPADPAEFLRAWEASFDWDMMRYPVLTKIDRGEHVYLQGQRLQRRGRETLARDQLEIAELPREISRQFGVDLRVVERALQILRRKGELHGDAAPR